jgi:hypothetical protein
MSGLRRFFHIRTAQHSILEWVAKSHNLDVLVTALSYLTKILKPCLNSPSKFLH